MLDRMGASQLEKLQQLTKYGLTRLYLPRWVPERLDAIEVEVGEVKPHFPRVKIRFGKSEIPGFNFLAGDVSPLEHRYLRMHRTTREIEGVALTAFEFEATNYPFQFSLNSDLRHYRDTEQRNLFLADLRADHGFPADEFVRVIESLEPFSLES